MTTLLKNGLIVKEDEIFTGNILIDKGIITDFPKPNAVSEGEIKVIDCEGLLVVPGLIDMHTHLREPGYEYKEDLESGSKAAVAGGVTTLCSMANTNPAVDNAFLVSWIRKRSKEIGLCDIYPYAALTKEMRGEELTEIGDIMLAGAAGLSDDGRPVLNSEVMRRGLEYASYFGAFIACHEEDTPLFNNGSMHEGRVSAVCGLKGAPAEAESVMVARDIALARLTGGHIHICHLSSKYSVEEIRRGKEAGVRVTCEVSPNHLSLTDEACESYNTHTKVNPPLRSEEDRQALIRGLKEGVIDCVATDHAPHHLDDKLKEYDLASFGMIGLQLTVPLLLEFVNRGIFSLSDFVRFTSGGPAKVLGLVDRGTLDKGKIADITIINTGEEYVFDEAVNRSKSSNTPYWDMRMKGRAVYTLKNGKVVHKA